MAARLTVALRVVSLLLLMVVSLPRAESVTAGKVQFRTGLLVVASHKRRDVPGSFCWLAHSSVCLTAHMGLLEAAFFLTDPTRANSTAHNPFLHMLGLAKRVSSTR